VDVPIPEPSFHPGVLIDILRRHAVIQGNDPAVTFIDDVGAEETWSYAELDARARAMAVGLLQRTRPGERALLLCPQGLEFVAAIVGCFYAGVVAVPTYPPGNARHLPRIARILTDSQASVVISTSSARVRIQSWLDGICEQGRIGELLVCEDVDLSLADRFVGAGPDPDSHAVIQYTSGSTMTPRGVIVTHRNLLANLAMIQDSFRFTSRSDTVSWLPVFHDMGLVGGVLEPLYLGARTVLLTAPSFIRRPAKWLEAITRFRPDYIGAPNFGYARCLDGLSAGQRGSLDLSSVRIAYCGAEPIDHRVADGFIKAFACCGLDPKAFYPCYGLAEATLLAAGSEPGTGGRRFHLDASALERGRAQRVAPGTPGVTVVFSCGRPARGTILRIVHPETRMPLADGQVGEVWLAGPNIAAGYWGNAEETRAVFGARLADESDNQAYLRTGDLGFIEAGEVCITGRIKDLLIIRGRNHYPQDIEQTAATAHPSLQPAGGGAAFPISIGGLEHAVVAYEVRRAALRQLDVRAVVGAIRGAVAQHHELSLQAVVLLQPGTLPRTSSGKVQRRACARAFASGELAEVFRWEAPVATADAPPALGATGDAPAALGRASAGSTERADRVIDWLRKYAESRIDSRLFDERRTISPHIVLDLGRNGVLGLRAPLEAGGLALSHYDMLRVLRQLAAIDATIASFVGVQNTLGLHPLLYHGSPEQLRRMLPDLAQGRQLASFAFTEAAAGSNPMAMRATAVENQDGTFSLSGSKRWIGTAAWAGYLHVFAHVIDRAGVNRGITAFTVAQDAPGLVQGPEELTVGLRGMVQNTVELRDVRVRPEDILGGLGRGMQIAQGILGLGRVCTAAAALGVLERSAQLMVRYAGRRQVASGHLLNNFISRERLTAVVVEAVALDLFVKSFAAWLDTGVDVPAEVYAAVKALSAETAYRGVDSLVQMLGGRGYIETNLAPQMMRDVRLLRIFEGPSETMLMFVGSRLAAGSTPLRSFLIDQLGARDLIEAMEDAVRALAQARVEAQPRSALLGELGIWAVWRAVLDARAGAGGHPLAPRARGWVGERLTSAFKAIEDTVAGAALQPLDADDIEAVVAGFARDIGDHEQHRPGVVEQLDPLLQRGRAPAAAAPTADGLPSVQLNSRLAPAGNASPASATPLSSPPAPLDRGAMERWLQQWIAVRFHENVDSVDRRRAFAEFGMDSVTSVELAGELSQLVGMEVPPTSLWEHPSIETLAAAIAGNPAVRGAAGGDHRSAGNRDVPERSRPNGVDLDRMSEREIAALLAAELGDRGNER
jgi:acyl-CoA synthetase (AMP-forming)/AMP-acid ligase II/alkylation response protein AidB-like acyl-CoA dehydrogenase/acyl carrier protein